MGRFITKWLRQRRCVCFSLVLGVAFSYVLSPYLENDCFPSFDRETKFFRSRKEDFRGDDYGQKSNVPGEPVKAKKTQQNLVRPRYYSSELGIRDSLLLGVLTTGNSVRDLAVAINKTSAHIVDKVLFFIDAAGAQKADVISLKLQGIVGFIDTKEILKPFHTIKYLFENFIDDYDYFFLTRDTTYTNSRLLNKILSKVSVSEELHAGSFMSSEDSHFCSLDGGVLLSNSIVKKIGSTLDWCVNNAYSDNDDDNLGRCILHASHLPCKQTIHGNLFESIVLPETNQMDFVSEPLSEAVTYSQIKDPKVMYKIHYHLSLKWLMETRKKEAEVKGQLGGGEWPPGTYPAHQPPSRFDLITWTYFDLSKLYFPSHDLTLKPLSGPDLTDIQNVLETSVTWLIEKYRGELSYRRLVNGYRRFDPSRGLDYILDLAFHDSSNQQVIKRIEACKPLGRVEVLQMPYVTENTRVTIILPVHAESAKQTLAFMNKYSQTFMQASELTFLLLVLLYDPVSPGKGHSQDVFKTVKEFAQDLTFKHRKDYSKIAWLSIKVPVMGSHPPLHEDLLQLAIVDLAMKKFPPDSIVLLTDPHAILSIEYINRVRMNTIPGRLVFSPVPFVQYDPEVVGVGLDRPPLREDLDVHKNTGHFNYHNTRHISFHLSDYQFARSKVASYLPKVKYDRDIISLFSGFDKAASAGEHIVCSLLELLVTHGDQASVLRAAEPSLRVCHSEQLRERCESVEKSASGSEARLAQVGSCVSERDTATGTRSHLARAVLHLNLSHLHHSRPVPSSPPPIHSV